MLIRLLLVFTLIHFSAVYAQVDESLHFAPRYKNKALSIGWQQGSFGFFEIGVHDRKYTASKCAFGSGISSRSLNLLYNPFQSVAGLGISAWGSAFNIVYLGAEVNTFTNFRNTSFGIKPEFGLGGDLFSVTYGRNFQFLKDPKDMALVKSSLTLRLYLTLFEKEIKEK